MLASVGASEGNAMSWGRSIGRVWREKEETSKQKGLMTFQDQNRAGALTEYDTNRELSTARIRLLCSDSWTVPPKLREIRYGKNRKGRG